MNNQANGNVVVILEDAYKQNWVYRPWTDPATSTEHEQPPAAEFKDEHRNTHQGAHAVSG